MTNVFTSHDVKNATVWLWVPNVNHGPEGSGLLLRMGDEVVLVGPTAVLCFPFRRREPEWVAAMLASAPKTRSFVPLDSRDSAVRGTGSLRGLTAVRLAPDAQDLVGVRPLPLVANGMRKFRPTDIAAAATESDNRPTDTTWGNASDSGHVGAPVLRRQSGRQCEVLGLMARARESAPLDAVLALAMRAVEANSPRKDAGGNCCGVAAPTANAK